MSLAVIPRPVSRLLTIAQLQCKCMVMRSLVGCSVVMVDPSCVFSPTASYPQRAATEFIARISTCETMPVVRKAMMFCRWEG